MTKQELIHKLTDLEWEDFEVKEAKGEVPKSAWETVSAFSNSAGGWLVFGVKQVAQKFNVQINPTCSKYVIDGKVILAFYIPVSKNKPVYFNSQANTYIRRGSADQKASKEEIDSLYRDQTFGTKTSEIAARTSLLDLREKSIREYRDYMSRFNSDVSYNRIELDDFLVKMRILDKESKQCTYAGLLFFGNRDSIESFFPDFRIDLFEIPGTSNQDASSRYTFRLSEDDYENLWEVYFECFKRLRKEVDVEFKLTAEGFGEELSPGLKSVREALVNMLMHADYFSPAHPRVRIFSNHIEYYNPGGLPKPLEELKGKDLSIPRNPILAKLFRMVKLAENAGYGLDKIEHNWKEYNGTSVDYVIDFDSTIVKLRTQSADEIRSIFGDLIKSFEKLIGEAVFDYGNIHNWFEDNYKFFTSFATTFFEISSENFQKNFGETSEEFRRNFGDKKTVLLLLIFFNPNITAQEAANKMKVSQRTIENYISDLKDKGVLYRIGHDRGGYWDIKTKEKL